jgi:hypothetical protein
MAKLFATDSLPGVVLRDWLESVDDTAALASVPRHLPALISSKVLGVVDVADEGFQLTRRRVL